MSVQSKNIFSMLSATCLCSILALSCKITDSRSALHVAGGIEAEPEKYPEVVLLELLPDSTGFRGSCTGTFISPTQVLTAAHCTKFEGLEQGQKITRWLTQDDLKGVSLWVNGKELHPSKFIKHPAYPQSKDFGCSHNADLAIFTFPSANSDKIASFSPKAPSVGASITIVGFGYTDFKAATGEGSGNKDRKKYKGSNKVRNVFEADLASIGASYCPEQGGKSDQLNTMIVFDGPLKDKTVGSNINDASSGAGDSGGPLFDENGKLAGTTSGAQPWVAEDGTRVYRSFYVNLSTDINKEFIISNGSGDAQRDASGDSAPGADGEAQTGAKADTGKGYCEGKAIKFSGNVVYNCNGECIYNRSGLAECDGSGGSAPGASSAPQTGGGGKSYCEGKAIKFNGNVVYNCNGGCLYNGSGQAECDGSGGSAPGAGDASQTGGGGKSYCEGQFIKYNGVNVYQCFGACIYNASGNAECNASGGKSI